VVDRILVPQGLPLESVMRIFEFQGFLQLRFTLLPLILAVLVVLTLLIPLQELLAEPILDGVQHDGPSEVWLTH